jgi:L-asparaginase/Glu-tRNA(Gln) amidotransferase subunit D
MTHDPNLPRRIAMISTGGTIEKTYDELRACWTTASVLDVMLASLRAAGRRDLSRVALMNKDSLDMTPADHDHDRAHRRHRLAASTTAWSSCTAPTGWR